MMTGDDFGEIVRTIIRPVAFTALEIVGIGVDLPDHRVDIRSSKCPLEFVRISILSHVRCLREVRSKFFNDRRHAELDFRPAQGGINISGAMPMMGVGKKGVRVI